MRTMCGSPCLHYDCSNRNIFGYCKTTVCINKHYYQEELWDLSSTTNKTENVIIKQPTNADRIRAMSDEELAEWINKHDCHTNLYGYDTKEAILDWLKQEVSDEKCMDV